MIDVLYLYWEHSQLFINNRTEIAIFVSSAFAMLNFPNFCIKLLNLSELKRGILFLKIWWMEWHAPPFAPCVPCPPVPTSMFQGFRFSYRQLLSVATQLCYWCEAAFNTTLVRSCYPKESIIDKNRTHFCPFQARRYTQGFRRNNTLWLKSALLEFWR